MSLIRTDGPPPVSRRRFSKEFKADGPARKRGVWGCCCRLGVMLSGFVGLRSCWGW